MNNSLLQETLSTIAIESERGGKFNRSFDLVTKLLKVYGEENLADTLYEDISLEYSWETVADLFAILIWSMSDKGSAALCETTDKWLVEGSDLRKIKIALNTDIYPFRNKTKMVEILSRLANHYSEISSKCNELIASRKED
jgi:hypothetical protein